MRRHPPPLPPVRRADADSAAGADAVNSPNIDGLPLFPLNTVLFPQGLLPLQIFEVRYLHMVAQCRKDDTPFGVVALAEGSEVRKPGPDGAAAEVLHPLGTLARIIEFSAPMPGLMHITALGGQRFRILRQQRLTNGLWVADVRCVAADPVAPIPAELAGVAQKLGRLIRVLQERGISARQMPLRPPFELEDCGWVANRWCELLPIPAATRQSLLAMDSPLLRLELIGDILDRTELPF